MYSLCRDIASERFAKFTDRSAYFEMSILRMALDAPGNIWLLQVLLLFRRQLLAPSIQRLVNPFDRGEANDGRCAPLDDPRKSHMTHLPSLLLRKFLYSLDDLLVALRLARCEHRSLLLTLASDRRPIC